MRRYQITIGNTSYDIEILAAAGGQARVLVNSRPYNVKYQPAAASPRAAGPAPAVSPRPAPAPEPKIVSAARPAPAPAPSVSPMPSASLEAVVAPMPGVILDVLVNTGDRVKVGDTVVKLEAMKMENDVRAMVAGVVNEIRVNKGANVSVGEVLLTLAKG